MNSTNSRSPFATAAYTNATVTLPAQNILTSRPAVRTPAPPISVTARELSAQLTELRQMIEDLAPPAPKNNKLSARLQRAGLEGPVASKVRALVAADPRAKSADKAEEAWTDALSQLVRVAPWPVACTQPQVITLVGPTGVGKTTTSAKLAARFVAEERTVTLVACDGFRVGAAQQLGRYAELMGAAFVNLKDEQELEHVITAAQTDVVILDTSGSAPKCEHFAQAARRSGRERATLLCMPACVRAGDAAHTAKAFAASRPTALCITKLDETRTPAGLLHALHAASLPISTLCHGPCVPDDMAAATGSAIVAALLGAAS